MFHVLINVKERHLKKHLHFILKMPNCDAAAVLFIQVHYKIKIHLLLQNVKKSAEECSFSRSYKLAASSFTRKKKDSFAGVFSRFETRLVVPYSETRYSYKFNSSCYFPSTTSTNFLVITLL